MFQKTAQKSTARFTSEPVVAHDDHHLIKQQYSKLLDLRNDMKIGEYYVELMSRLFSQV